MTLFLRFFVATGDVCAVGPTEAAIVAALDALAAERDPWRRVSWLRALDEASGCLDSPGLAEQLRRDLPDAVDAVEAAVRRQYEPGLGLVDGSPAAQARAALALLDAFDLTGRLPYAMLAEELVAAARSQAGSDGPGGGTAAERCACARALCRVAVLRRDPEYVARSVPVPAVSAGSAAARLLHGVDLGRLDLETDGPAYALALAEWLAVGPDLQ